MDRTTAELMTVIAREKTRRVAGRWGEYRVWRSPAGAEIWLHYPARTRARAGGGESKPLDLVEDLKGFTVFHAGRGRVALELAEMRQSGIDPLGAVCVEAARARGQPRLGFEVVGYAALDQMPRQAELQLCALAYRLWAFPSESAYFAGVASQRLIAPGALARIEPGDVPEARQGYRAKRGTLWLLSGRVRASMRLLNPLTHVPYYWLLVETDRGVLDVVVNSERIDGDVSTGHIVQVVGTMAGRVLSS